MSAFEASKLALGQQRPEGALTGRTPRREARPIDACHHEHMYVHGANGTEPTACLLGQSAGTTDQVSGAAELKSAASATRQGHETADAPLRFEIAVTRPQIASSRAAN